MTSVACKIILSRELFKEEKKIKPMATAKVGLCSSGNLIRRKHGRHLVIASASNPKGLDMMKGKKVNGIHHNEETHHQLLLKQRVSKAPLHACLLGRFVGDRFMYRQTFIIRSYEIGPDKTATMETLLNLLQVCLSFISSSLLN